MSVSLFKRFGCLGFNIKYLCNSSPTLCRCKRLQVQTDGRNTIYNSFLLEQKRFKYNNKSKSLEEESSEEDTEDSDDDDQYNGEGVTLTGQVPSLRVDSVLKAGLKIARNKVELMFYEGRIRLNGKKIFKKSVKVNVKDEIDVIRGVSNMNSLLLSISRVIVMKVTKNDTEEFVVKMKRYKNLNIEDYPDEHRWSN